MSKLIINIKQLTQVRSKDISFVKPERMNELPSISDAFLFVKNGVIADFGKTLDGRLMLYDSQLVEWTTLKLKKDPECIACKNNNKKE